MGIVCLHNGGTSQEGVVAGRVEGSRHDCRNDESTKKNHLECLSHEKDSCGSAVLGAFAGTAMAADVTLYGIVDLGLADTTLTLIMARMVSIPWTKSGAQSGSRFGLKGVEDLGNGMQVGFVLENGFNADDGKLAMAAVCSVVNLRLSSWFLR